MKKILEAILRLLPKAKKPALVIVQRPHRNRTLNDSRVRIINRGPALSWASAASSTAFIAAAISVAVFAAAGCKKSFDAEPTYARQTIAATWAKNEPFYQPQGERYDDSTGVWRKFSAFTVTSDLEPDKIGFVNPYVAGKGTNALDMNRLYTAQKLTSDSGYYNITIPKCFQFVPNADDPTQGTVVVLSQEIKIYRTDKSSFVIKISPGSVPGTFNTNTKVFQVEVTFDESSIGGPSAIKRKYRFTS